MDKVQKIREEVVRMHNLLPIMDGDNISVNYADRICTTLEIYIDSMQEEPSKDFRERYKKIAQTEAFKKAHRRSVGEENNICCMKFDDIDAARIAAYEDGKKAMKEQMMKEAVEGEVRASVRDLLVTDRIVVDYAERFGLKEGDKVKIIILKDEQGS